jgi:hypothetical protein
VQDGCRLVLENVVLMGGFAGDVRMSIAPHSPQATEAPYTLHQLPKHPYSASAAEAPYTAPPHAVGLLKLTLLRVLTP